MHHSRGLRLALSKDNYDPNRIDAILNGLQRNDVAMHELSKQDQAMLKYSAKLSKSPAEMNESDVQELRSVGFDDRSIHDIACIVGYFAFVNRVADGLGVELEN